MTLPIRTACPTPRADAIAPTIDAPARIYEYLTSLNNKWDPGGIMFGKSTFTFPEDFTDLLKLLFFIELMPHMVGHLNC